MQANHLNQKYNVTAYRNSMQRVKRYLYNIYIALAMHVSLDVNVCSIYSKIRILTREKQIISITFCSSVLCKFITNRHTMSI